jgi:hypothetical protein
MAIVMLRSERISKILCVPCVAGVLLWLVLFVEPELGFRRDLTAPLVIVLVASFVSAGTGIAVVSASKKGRAAWAFFWFFVGVTLLHLFGFLWSLGAVANAYA